MLQASLPDPLSVRQNHAAFPILPQLLHSYQTFDMPLPAKDVPLHSSDP